MAASNFNLRGISPEVMVRLKQEAKEKHISVNLLILKIIEQGLGLTTRSKRVRYQDLDALAGTWTKQEAQRFEENIKRFLTIDEELWR